MWARIRLAPGLEPATAIGARGARQRGFSLVELMVVVIIITVLAVVAIPQITRRMKDQQTQKTAQTVAALYRNARMRAIGRGGAVMVRYNNTGGGSLQMLEAVEDITLPGACPMMPVASCTLTTWTVGTDAALVDQLNLTNQPPGPFIAMTALGPPPGNSTPTDMDVCFTPGGQTLVRIDSPTGPWQPLAGVPVIQVALRGMDSAPNDPPLGLTRRVLLLPNGAARLGVAE